MRAEIESSTDLMALRYPIGQRVSRATFTSESRSAAFAAIRELPASLRHTVVGLSDAQLDTPYRANGWTVRQVSTTSTSSATTFGFAAATSLVSFGSSAMRNR